MAINPGNDLNSVPSSLQQALSTNYLDLASEAGKGWAQQYLPDLMEKEAEVFGPRTISGFLAQVGAEEAMTADQVVWSEQSRLHLSYKGHINSTTTNGGQIDIDSDIDETSGFTAANHGIRVNDSVIVANADGVAKCLVSNVSNARIDVRPYGAASLNAAGLSNTGTSKETTVLVYGSEFVKGVGYNQKGGTHSDSRTANEPDFKSFTNKPIIMKDYYEVSGSDASRIGWVEVSTESGQGGYLWYLKAEADTRARFTDYVEMSMLESEIGLDSTAETVIDEFFYGADGG